MRAEEREHLEEEVQALCQQGDNARAVERVLEGYGPELLRLMASVLHDPERARDAFSLFSESLLKGLPGFRWESSLRTWAYRLARNACYQVVHAPAAVREQVMSMSALPEEPVHAPRSATQPWQRTSVKERFRALRERLAPEERMLLVLRVDRRLSWQEVARVLAEPGEELTSAEVNRRAAALRQQFQRLKAHLRTLAMEEGLLSSNPTH